MSYKKKTFLVALTTLSMLLAGCGGGSKGSEQASSEITSSSVSESSKEEQSISSEESSDLSSSQSQSSEISSSEETPVSSSSEEPVVVTAIEIKENTVPNRFAVGDEFTVEGGQLLVTYSNNDVKEVDMTLDMIANPPEMDEEQLGYVVNIFYEGASTSYAIDIVLEVRKISVVEGTDLKTTYNVGDEFIVEGGELQVTYSDNSRKTIDMTLEMIDNPPTMDEAIELYEVKVTYQNAHASYQITIIDRLDATIGVSYTYNYSEYVEIENFDEELVFVEGKDYHFSYGANPEKAIDSISYQYLRRGDNPGVLDARPLEVGEYTYRVYIPNNDETYKPTERLVNYKIEAPIIENFSLNHETIFTLTDEASNVSGKICGLNVGVKNAKAATEGAVTLTKSHSYIEILDPTAFTSGITVNFKGIDKYVAVYASYDGEEFVFVDTLSEFKSTTDRAKDYFYVRLCSYLIEGDELVIDSVNFSYEVLGAPNGKAVRAEISDLINTATSEESNQYFVYNKEVHLDEERSIKSMGIRGKELSVNIQFKTVLKQEEIKRYNLEFFLKPTDNATYQQSKDDATVADVIGVYAKPTNAEGKTVGSHIKVLDNIPAGPVEEWSKVTVDLVAFFNNDGLQGDITGINVWINRFCTTGHVLFDDFRLVQKESYPEKRSLSYIILSGDIVTEFDKGDEFVFGGVVTAHYSDWGTKVIAEDDENLTIAIPNMNSSGEKTVTVSYVENGKTKKATYTINVIGADPKTEETLDIVNDEYDLANKAHQFKSSHSYDQGIAADESENTYNDSTNAIKVSGLTLEDYYLYLRLNEGIKADAISVRFFAKGLGTHSIYLQLFSEDESEKAYRDVDQVDATKPKGDATTTQGKANSFVYTDAGNGWGRYEYTYYGGHLTKELTLLRIAIGDKMTASEFFYLDGIEVYC